MAVYASLLKSDTTRKSKAVPSDDMLWSDETAELLNAAIKNKKLEEAFTVLAEAVRIAPQCYQVYYFLGWLQSRIAAYDDAAASLNSALRLNPDSVRTLQLLAQVHFLRLDFDACRKTNFRLRKLLPEMPVTKRITDAISQVNRLYKQVS
jgi:tetratricopeptide (TPR) repeat protein